MEYDADAREQLALLLQMDQHMALPASREAILRMAELVGRCYRASSSVQHLGRCAFRGAHVQYADITSCLSPGMHGAASYVVHAK